MKRFLLLAALIGVFAWSTFILTTESVSAHEGYAVRGSRLETIHERHSCEHLVIFFVRDTEHHRFMEVWGPDRTHPVIVAEYGHRVIARYWIPGRTCWPDYRHDAHQFLLRVF